jgi:predicted kinase
MIILVFGLPGSGKTFFSRHLKNGINACHLNTDIVRHEMNKGGQYDAKTKLEVYNRLMDKVAEKLNNGWNVIIDGTFHNQDRRKEIAEFASENGHDIYFIEIRASEQNIKKRLEKKREYSEADYEVYLQIKKEFDPYPEPHLVLWSDSQNIDEMVIMAKNYIYGYPADKCPSG